MSVRSRHDALVREYLRKLGWGLHEMDPNERDQLMSEITDHIARARAELGSATEEDVRGVLERLGPPEAIVAEAAEQQELGRGRRRHANGQVLHPESAKEATLQALVDGAEAEWSSDPSEQPAGTAGTAGAPAQAEAAGAPGQAAPGRAAPAGATGTAGAARPAGDAKPGRPRRRATRAVKERTGTGVEPEMRAISLLLAGGLLLVVGWFVGAVLLWRSRVFTWQDKLVGTLVLPGGVLPAIYVLIRPIGGPGWPVRLVEFALCVLLAVSTSVYLHRRVRTLQVASGFETFRARRAEHAAERARNEMGLG